MGVEDVLKRENFLMDISSNCNLECKYCYLNIKGSLSKGQILSRAKESDCSEISIGGGEPAIYPRISDIAEEILSLEKKINISTNGTVLMDELIKLPEKTKEMIRIQVSLPALKESLFEKITGKNMLKNVLKNIEIYQKNIYMEMNFVVFDENVDELESIIRFAKEKLIPLKISPAINTRENKRLLNERNLEKIKKNLIGKLFSGYEIFSPLNILSNPCIIYENQFGIKKENLCSAEQDKSSYIAPDNSLYSCEYLANMIY